MFDATEAKKLADTACIERNAKEMENAEKRLEEILVQAEAEAKKGGYEINTSVSYPSSYDEPFIWIKERLTEKGFTVLMPNAAFYGVVDGRAITSFNINVSWGIKERNK